MKRSITVLSALLFATMFCFAANADATKQVTIDLSKNPIINVNISSMKPNTMTVTTGNRNFVTVSKTQKGFSIRGIKPFSGEVKVTARYKSGKTSKTVTTAYRVRVKCSHGDYRTQIAYAKKTLTSLREEYNTASETRCRRCGKLLAASKSNYTVYKKKVLEKGTATYIGYKMSKSKKKTLVNLHNLITKPGKTAWGYDYKNGNWHPGFGSMNGFS